MLSRRAWPAKSQAVPRPGRGPWSIRTLGQARVPTVSPAGAVWTPQCCWCLLPSCVCCHTRLLSVPVAGSRGIPGAYSLLLSLPQGFSSPGGAPATATQAPAAHSVRTESRGQAGLPALRKRGHSVAGLLEPFLPQQSWPALGAPHTQASVLGQSSRAPTLCPLGTKPSGDTEAVLAGALWPRLG